MSAVKHARKDNVISADEIKTIGNLKSHCGAAICLVGRVSELIDQKNKNVFFNEEPAFSLNKSYN